VGRQGRIVCALVSAVVVAVGVFLASPDDTVTLTAGGTAAPRPEAIPTVGAPAGVTDPSLALPASADTPASGPLAGDGRVGPTTGRTTPMSQPFGTAARRPTTPTTASSTTASLPTPAPQAPPPTGPPTTTPAPSGSVSLLGKIVYASDADGPMGRNGQEDIWVMDADGSNARRLLSPPGINLAPDLSPDGRRIVWANFDRSHTPNGWNIVVANVDGSDLTTLVKPPGQAFYPKFSPDGSRILFRGAPYPSGYGHTFFTMTDDGSDIRPVPGTAELRPERAAWAPDGRHIVVDSITGDATGPYGLLLYVLDLDDGSSHRIGRGGAAAWSPDGDRIAYAGENGIWVMGSDGSDPRPVATGACAEPAWSADGTRLAYRCTAEGPYGDHDIWTARPDGTEAMNLTLTAPFQEMYPTF
jgi:Tol biopolymer transport system component